MLLDKSLHVRQLEPDHGSRPLAVAHARDTDARKLPPLGQLVNERQADLQNSFNLFCVEQLHLDSFCKSPVFYKTKIPSVPNLKFIFSKYACAGAALTPLNAAFFIASKYSDHILLSP